MRPSRDPKLGKPPELCLCMSSAGSVRNSGSASLTLCGVHEEDRGDQTAGARELAATAETEGARPAGATAVWLPCCGCVRLPWWARRFARFWHSPRRGSTAILPAVESPVQRAGAPGSSARVSRPGFRRARRHHEQPTTVWEHSITASTAVTHRFWSTGMINPELHPSHKPITGARFISDR